MRPLDSSERRPSRLPRRLVILAILMGVVFLGLSIFRVGPVPELELALDPPGIGPASTVTATVREPSRGLGTVRLELVQGTTVFPIEEGRHSPLPAWKFWGERTRETTLEGQVGKDRFAGLEEGVATLRLTAERAGTWLRSPGPVVQELEVPVKLRPPTLDLVAVSPALRQGGAAVAVYRVGPGAVRDGVVLGERFFPGSALAGGGEGERVVFFGAPHDLADPSALRLVVADELGNQASRSVVRSYQRREPTPAVIELSDGFFAKVLPEILERSPSIRDQGDPLANYLAVNRELRRINNETFAALAAGTRQELLWNQPFLRLPGGQRMAPFADRRSYRYDGEVVDQQVHLGMDLASVRRAQVPAANPGVVVLASYQGIYGNTVVVDHGYGLMSLYSHLSSISVEEGQTVGRGEILGRSGETGLAGGDHLHFSMLVHGLMVDPVEWWDGAWVENRVLALLRRSTGEG